MLAPGQLLQTRYQINRRLGAGGMGSIFEAVDLRLSALVAVKENLLAADEVRRSFEREAQLLANLHHPALPRVRDYFAEGEGLYIVMDFIPGEDLRVLLDRRPTPFSWEEVSAWLPGLLDALSYLHTREPQVLHRDIKPSNLKLTPAGRVYLLDFGLARGAVGQMPVATLSRSVFGYSPHYSSLEQIQGDRTTARSDIYALGATLYFLLSKVLPADALLRATALVNEEPDPLGPLERLAPHLPPGVAEAVNRSLALKPSDRPASVEEFREIAFSSVFEPEPGGSPPQEREAVAAIPPAAPGENGEDETQVAHKPRLQARMRNFLSPATAIALAVGILGVLLAGYALLTRRQAEPGPPRISPSVAPPTPLSSSSAVTPRLPTPTPPPSPTPSPSPEATPKEADLTGQWEMTNRVLSASYAPYRGLRLGYRLTLRQRGSIVTGDGEKVSENGQEIGPGARSPISLRGKLERGQLTLSFVEHGALRATTGTFRLRVNEAGTKLTGTFTQTAARSRGETEAIRTRTHAH